MRSQNFSVILLIINHVKSSELFAAFVGLFTEEIPTEVNCYSSKSGAVDGEIELSILQTGDCETYIWLPMVGSDVLHGRERDVLSSSD
jgi:hypothetical protein